MVVRSTFLVCTVALSACGQSVRTREENRHPNGVVDVANYGSEAQLTAYYTEREPTAPVSEFGDCVVYEEPSPPPRGTYLDAGTVTLAGTLLTRDDDGQYRATRAAFEPSEIVTFEINGSAEVPAHAAILAFPSALSSPEITTPLVEVDRAEDFSPTWTPRPDGSVRVGFAAVPNGSGELAISVVCTVPASAGTVTIPSDALAALPPTAERRYGTHFILYHMTDADSRNAEWTFWFIARDVQQAPEINVR